MLTLDLPARAWQDLAEDFWTQEMRCYGPDDDDGDGETDEHTPIVVVTPWDTDGGDDDRRFAEWERSEWDAGFQAGRNGDRLASGTQAYADGYDAGAWQLQRVEAAALADYDSWLTLGERESLDTLARHFGPFGFDGVTAWLGGLSATVYRWWLDRLGLGHLPCTEWVITAPAGGGLAVQVRGGCDDAN